MLSEELQVAARRPLASLAQLLSALLPGAAQVLKLTDRQSFEPGEIMSVSGLSGLRVRFPGRRVIDRHPAGEIPIRPWAASGAPRHLAQIL